MLTLAAVLILVAGLAVLLANSNQPSALPKSSLPLVTAASATSTVASTSPALSLLDSPELTAQVTISGDPLPRFDSEASSDPAWGRAIPEVVGANFLGEPVSITANGKAKLLIFLAHWCPHCQAEVPRIQAWIDQNGVPESVELISIATSINTDRPNFPVQDWLEREGWSLPVLIDDSDLTVLRAYGMGAFPAFVVIGADGTVMGRAVGKGIDLSRVVGSLEENQVAASG